MRLAVLSYGYVEAIVERREPYRDDHLALAARFREQGRLLIAGALGDPPSGALLVFTDADAAEEFAAADPYGAAGLLTERSVEPWNVVIHAPLPAAD